MDTLEQQIARAAATAARPPERPTANGNGQTNGSGSERGVTQAELTTGHGKADTTKAVALALDLNVQATLWLRQRVHAIEQMQQRDNVRLTQMDQLINTYKDSLLSGTLTKDKLAILYHGVNDSLIQVGASIGRVTSLKTGEGPLQKDHLTLGRFADNPGPPVERYGFSAESDLLSASGVDKLPPHLVREQVASLINLRSGIEMALFGKDPTSTLPDVGTSTHPRDYRENNGNIFHDKIVDHITTVLMRRGETFNSLPITQDTPHEDVARAYEAIYGADMGKGVEILRQANEMALIDNSNDVAKKFLRAEDYSSQASQIESRAVKLESPTADEEERTKLTEAQTKATEEYDKASTELTELKARRDTLKTEIDEADIIVREKQNELNQSEDALRKVELESIDAHNIYTAHQATKNPTALQTAIDAQLALVSAIDARGGDEKARTTAKKPHLETAEKIRQELATYHTKLIELQQTDLTARRLKDIQEDLTKRNRKRLTGIDTKLTPTDKVKGEIQAAEKIRDTKKKELKKLEGYGSHKGLIKTKEDDIKNPGGFDEKKKTAEKAVTDAQQGSKEGKDKAKELRDWKKLANSGKQNEIITELVTANNNEFSIDKLILTIERAPGQIEGLERMRELVFKTLNGQDYDPELARKILPDEAIAKAMVWVFKLDIAKTYPGTTPPPVKIEDHMTALAPLQADLQTKRNELKSLEAATPRVEAAITAKKTEIETAQAAITTAGHDFAKMLLPELKNRTRFERGELVKFIMEQGILASARQGDPYLNLNDFDDRIRNMQESRFAIEGEVFDESKFGHSDITEQEIAWNDKVTRPGASRTGSNLDITYRVKFKASAEDNQGRLAHENWIKLDQHYYERLPMQRPNPLPAWIPNEADKLFYTKSGYLRADYKYTNEWWKVGPLKTKELKMPGYTRADVVSNTADSQGAMTLLRSEIPGAEQRVPKSVGYAVLYDLTPEQRLARLRGMDSKLMDIPLSPPVDADTSKLNTPAGTFFSLEFDAQGEIYVQQTNTGDRKRWDLFFKDIRDGYRGATVATGHTERGDVQEYLTPLLDRLGLAALDSKRLHQ